MTIINDDSRVINKLEALLTDDARVMIYDRHMFLVQATGTHPLKAILDKIYFTHSLKFKSFTGLGNEPVILKIFIFFSRFTTELQWPPY